MKWSEQCASVLPCLNEAATIGALVRDLRNTVAEVVVVNDGSSDNTQSLAAGAGAVVLNHSRRRGKGAAVITGLRYARAAGYSWALLLDSDGQHLASEVPRLFAAAQSSGARLVIGNRMHRPGPMPIVRRVANQWLSHRVSSLAGCVIPDSQCGFRLVHLTGLDLQSWRATNFEIESEMIVACARLGWRITSVPITARYAGETSRIRPVVDSWRWLKWYLGARFASRLTGCRDSGSSPLRLPLPQSEVQPLAPS